MAERCTADPGPFHIRYLERSRVCSAPLRKRFVLRCARDTPPASWRRYLMFVLAHLSAPHLGPLPDPRVVELIGKRATGYVNWQRRRERMHRPEVLAKVVADIKRQGADHIAVTGDLVNLA